MSDSVQGATPRDAVMGALKGVPLLKGKVRAGDCRNCQSTYGC